MSSEANSREKSIPENRGVIVWSVVTTLVVVGLVLVLWKYALPPLQPGAATETQTTTAAELATIRSIEDSLLTTYQWHNRDSGTCRIPIERAIELIASDAITPAR